MEYITLGRTGLEVSVVGFGCGGPSRLGLRDGSSTDHAVALIRQALDRGISFLDTAEAYGAEAIVGKAIKTWPRDKVIISTKKTLPPPNLSNLNQEVRRGLGKSLRQLGTDYVDTYHLHGVEPQDVLPWFQSFHTAQCSR
jgi:L-galactose dehydrogenase